MNEILYDRFNKCNITTSDILNKITSSDSKQVVFIYTSQLEDLGTKDSDFDVYVLSESMPNGEFVRSEQGYKVQITLLNGKLLDVEYWDIKVVFNLISTINSLNNTILSSDELKLIHRLKIAEVVTENETGNKIQILIQNSSLKKHVIKHYLLYANSKLQDAIALYDSQQYISALNCARFSLEQAIGALNAKNGFTNLKSKWISKIFINNNGYDKELLNKYLQYQVYCNVNSGNIETFVENILEFTQNIITMVAL
ncbi:hypothetical protein [Clostridium estertheticum]|uniref:hypothetical protein n=1 Tax=Clostridium estertheticum TaxID=238834 RepID=UPI00124D9739|nr:hypothetical protein [Clostridium estertheticum]MBZ9618257.1 hypothetical protein [Clostridium estertheticum subsp. laramiense]WAG76241.1 hypothetical protein LL032_23960 [Clostridium estertheticum]